jgi:hypothetical protein
MTLWDTEVVVRLAVMPALRRLGYAISQAPVTPMSYAIAITWVAVTAFVILASIPKEFFGWR